MRESEYLKSPTDLHNRVDIEPRTPRFDPNDYTTPILLIKTFKTTMAPVSITTARSAGYGLHAPKRFTGKFLHIEVIIENQQTFLGQ